MTLVDSSSRIDSVFKTASIEGAALSSAIIQFAALSSTRLLVVALFMSFGAALLGRSCDALFVSGDVG
jgi:hypothetical protein